MPFFVLRLCPLHEENEDLIWSLAQSPNGTPLCCAQPIWTRNMSGLMRLYWLNDKDITSKRLREISSMSGVERFDRLEVSWSIHDSDWIYEDDFIDQRFLPILTTMQGQSGHLLNPATCIQ